MLLQAKSSVLLVVDVQARLLPAMAEPDLVTANSAKLVAAAKRLAVPVLVSEQYPKGLGPTVEALAGAGTVLAKMSFSCAADPGIAGALERLGRRQIVLCGIESHVCVLQTALGLKAKGYEVAVVWDAVSSRKPADKDLAAGRLRRNDVDLIGTEMAIFEWLGVAGTPEFKELSALIK
jgi:nicotinamidase-related amidase